jgi:hypothetical protein
MPYAVKMLQKATVFLISKKIQTYLKESYHSKRRNQVGSTFRYFKGADFESRPRDRLHLLSFL